jgi:hypothetical protein
VSARIGVVVVAVVLALWPRAGFDATVDETLGPGPWRARIVDADTGTPLEGVVVLAVWDERFASVGGLGGGGYFDSEEVVTGPDGTFMIRRPRESANRFSVIKGPEFYIFKPGYGEWRFQGVAEWPESGRERARKVAEAWARFNSAAGVVLEMPPLPTRKARLDFLAVLHAPNIDVPVASALRFFEARDRERGALGLPPMLPGLRRLE